MAVHPSDFLHNVVFTDKPILPLSRSPPEDLHLGLQHVYGQKFFQSSFSSTVVILYFRRSTSVDGLSDPRREATGAVVTRSMLFPRKSKKSKLMGGRSAVIESVNWLSQCHFIRVSRY